MGIRRFATLAFLTLVLAACQNASDSSDPGSNPTPPDIAEDDEREEPTFDPFLNGAPPAPTAVGGQCRDKSTKPGRFEVHPSADPCGDKLDTRLLYVFLHRAMYVCENGRTTWANFVSGGKGGFRKQKQGDKKVPEGIYELGTPRGSAQFGVFIPIGYPNAEDKLAGRTGSMVGIHGPVRKFACDGANNSLANWTNGCIAYPSDNHVHHLALWVKKNPDAYIELREK